MSDNALHETIGAALDHVLEDKPEARYIVILALPCAGGGETISMSGNIDEKMLPSLLQSAADHALLYLLEPGEGNA